MKKKTKPQKKKKVKITFQDLPKTKCCDDYKTGNPYTIPLGFLDLKGTRRTVEFNKQPYTTNMYYKLIDKPVEPREPEIEAEELIEPEEETRPRRLRRTNKEIYADLIRQTTSYEEDRVKFIVNNTPKNELRQRINELKERLR